MSTASQFPFPKYMIIDPTGLYAADVNSSSQLVTTGGGSGNPQPPIGSSRVVICGPSGYCASVNSSAQLSTT